MELGRSGRAVLGLRCAGGVAVSEQEWAEQKLPLDIFDPITGTLCRPAFVELCAGRDPEDSDPDEQEAW